MNKRHPETHRTKDQILAELAEVCFLETTEIPDDEKSWDKYFEDVDDDLKYRVNILWSNYLSG